MAAIQATRNAGKCGKARTKSLCQLSTTIFSWQTHYGSDNVAFRWVKSHIGIDENEKADKMAKMGSEKEGRERVTEGVLRQWEKDRRRQVRVRKGFIDITKWHKNAPSTYTQLRMNRRNLTSWLVLIRKAQGDQCRWCKIGLETQEYLVFDCLHWDFWRPLREIEWEWRK